MPTPSSHSADNGKQRTVPSRIGRFVILERVGGGAFGVVFRAFDPQLEREVALKLPRAGTLTTPRRVERFLGDAKSAAQLRHPHIVPVFDCGKDGEWIYIASAYVRGQTLADAIDGPMDPARAARIVMKLADALAYAHGNGIVHRDVKPQNVVLDEHDEPHLIDFGLAQRGEKTEDGKKVLGTYGYMSPEQAAGNSGEAKPAFDQYALGVTLYELLTGRTPFGGSGEMKRFHTINTPPPPPAEVNANAPLDLALICLKAMAKHADNRYPDCAAMAADLRAFLVGGVPSVRELTPRERLIRWVRTEPKLASAVGAVGLLVLLLAAVGVAFGAYSAKKNKDLEIRKTEAETAKGEAVEKAKEAIRSKQEADESAQQARASARTATARRASATFDHALGLGERGEVGQCMIELAKALALVDRVLAESQKDGTPAEQAKYAELGAVIRQNLAGWRRQLHRLAAIHELPASPSWVAFHPQKPGAVLFGCESGVPLSHVSSCDLASGTADKYPAAGELLTRTAVTSPDGALLLTISQEGVARLFDITTGGPVGGAIRPEGTAKILSGAVMDRRRVILGYSDGAVVAHRCDGGEWVAETTVRHKLLGGCEVRVVALHPSGELVLTGGWNSQSGQLVLRRTEKLAPVCEIGSALKPVTAAAFAPDGRTFATGHGTLLDGEVRVWDLETRELRQGGIFRHQSEVYAVTFSRDGRYLATASQDRSARVFDAQALTQVGQPLWHLRDVLAVAFSPDGRRLVTAGREEALRVWELAPGPAAEHLEPHGPVIALAPHLPTNRIFTGGGLPPGQEWIFEKAGFREHKLPVEDVSGVRLILAAAYSPRGDLLLLGSGHPGQPDLGGHAILFGSSGEQLGADLLHPGPVLAVAFDPQGGGKRFVTGCTDGVARIYDHTKPKEEPAKFDHAAGKKGVKVYAVRFSPDGQYLLTGGTDGRALLWDVKNREVFASLPHSDAVLSAAFSADGQWIVTGYAGAAMLWKWGGSGKPQEVGRLPHGPAGVVSVDIAPDGESILTGGTDGTARWWDRKTLKPLGPMWRPGPTAKHVTFWPGKKMLVAGTDLRSGCVMVIDQPPAVATQHDVMGWVRAATGLDAELTVLELDKWKKANNKLQGQPEPEIEKVIREEAARKVAPPKPAPSPWKGETSLPKPKDEGPPPAGMGVSIPPFDGLLFLARVLGAFSEDPGRPSQPPMPKPKDEGSPPPPAPGTAGKFDPPQIVGKWKPKKNENMVIEFKKDGKLEVTGEVVGKDMKLEGTYKLEGNKLTFKLKFGDVAIEETVTITKLTDDELEGKDKNGEPEAFMRVKERKGGG